MKKKLLCILLTFTMVLSLVPAFGISSVSASLVYSELKTDAKREAFGLVVQEGNNLIKALHVIVPGDTVRYNEVEAIQQRFYKLIQGAKTDKLARTYGAIGSQMMVSYQYATQHQFSSEELELFFDKQEKIIDNLESRMKTFVIDKGYSDDAVDALGGYTIMLSYAYCFEFNETRYANVDSYDLDSCVLFNNAESEEELISYLKVCGEVVHILGRIDSELKENFDIVTGIYDDFKEFVSDNLDKPAKLLAASEIYKYSLRCSYGLGVSEGEIKNVHLANFDDAIDFLIPILNQGTEDDMPAIAHLAKGYIAVIRDGGYLGYIINGENKDVMLPIINNFFTQIVNRIILEDEVGNKMVIAKATVGSAYVDSALCYFSSDRVWVQLHGRPSIEEYYMNESVVKYCYSNTTSIFVSLQDYLYFEDENFDDKLLEILDYILEKIDTVSGQEKKEALAEASTNLYWFANIPAYYTEPAFVDFSDEFKQEYSRICKLFNDSPKAYASALTYIEGHRIATICSNKKYDELNYQNTLDKLDKCEELLSKTDGIAEKAVRYLATPGGTYFSACLYSDEDTLLALNNYFDLFYDLILNADSEDKAFAYAILEDCVCSHYYDREDDEELFDDYFGYFKNQIANHDGDDAAAIAYMAYYIFNYFGEDWNKDAFDLTKKAVEALDETQGDASMGVMFALYNARLYGERSVYQNIIDTFDKILTYIKDSNEAGGLAFGRIAYYSLNNISVFNCDTDYDDEVYVRTTNNIEDTKYAFLLGVSNGITGDDDTTPSSSGGGGSVAPVKTTKVTIVAGDDESTQKATVGDKISTLKTPEAPENKVFAGWYYDEELTKPASGEEKIEKNTKLYAAFEMDPKCYITMVIGKNDAVVFGEAISNDVAPIIRNDRTMLPCRFVAESLGATVEWNGAERKVTITTADGKTVIELVIDKAVALVNGEDVTLDSAPFIENDRTYLPVRFIAENLGAEVLWDEATQQVTIIAK